MNIEISKKERNCAGIFRYVEQAKGDSSKVHLDIMSRTDFWKIFPSHGKFVMATKFEENRKKAVIMTRWMLIAKGFI